MSETLNKVVQNLRTTAVVPNDLHPRKCFKTKVNILKC